MERIQLARLLRDVEECEFAASILSTPEQRSKYEAAAKRGREYLKRFARRAA